MTKPKTILLAAFAVAGFGAAGFAKTPVLTGKVVAYDPLQHAAKESTFAANKETIILQSTGTKIKYLKVIFVSFGTTQTDPKYFDGSVPLTVKALRDRTCDENSPKFVQQVGVDQSSGTYLLTEAFKNSPPPKIKSLECYDVAEKK
jgi:hypothetical protein